MKNFISWLKENYAPRNRNWLIVRDYLKNAEKNFDVLGSWVQFMDWHKARKIAKKLSLDLEDDNKKYDNAAKINKYMMDNPKLLEEFLYSYLNSEEAPAYTNMQYLEDLPPTTWLVHFSDNAFDIAYEGFKYGTGAIGGMHYTRGGTYKSRTSSGSGYNFAFLADSPEANSAAEKYSYGSDAVMFMSAGVLTQHISDEEEQVVFDGANVNPKDIVYLKRNSRDEWVVKAKGLKNKRDPYANSDFIQVVEWVMSNWQQYRRIIMG